MNGIWDNVNSYKHWISKGKAYCAYCDRELKKYPKTNNPLHPTCDHQVPVSRGGKDSIENIVPCCTRCNKMKDNMTVGEFLDHITMIKNHMSGN